MFKVDFPQPFWDNIWVTPSGCWLWCGQANGSDYGTYRHKGVRNSTHRLMYEAFVGTIPSDLEIDHLCALTRCCNPRHLESVTHRENLLRAEAREVECINDHPWTPDNTFYRSRGPDRERNRRCLTCYKVERRKAEDKRSPRERPRQPV